MSTGLGSLLRATNRSVSRVGTIVAADYLPVFFHGNLLWLARDSWDTVYLRYEPHIARAIRKHLPRGGVFYDVGAHFGLWTAYAARIAGRSGRVVCCEPSQAFQALDKNTRRMAQIESLRIAIGDRQTEMVFHGQGSSMSGSLIRAVTEINEQYSPGVPIEAVTVPMQSLDSLSEHRRDPDVIKVDVEGYECKVLEGARALMERASPVWLIEIHPPQLHKTGDSEEACLSLLEQAGYSVRVISRYPNSIYTVMAHRRESALSEA